MADPVFRSKLSNDLDAFITQKRAAGHPYGTSARVLGYLDDMIIEKYPESSVLTKEICNAWIKECSKLHQTTLLRRNKMPNNRKINPAKTNPKQDSRPVERIESDYSSLQC